MVGPLRGGGVKPSEPLRKKTLFFYEYEFFDWNINSKKNLQKKSTFSIHFRPFPSDKKMVKIIVLNSDSTTKTMCVFPKYQKYIL